MFWRALLWFVVLAPMAQANCADVTFEGTSLTTCTVDLTEEDLRLFLKDGNGRVYGHFSAIERDLDAGSKLGFAMNGGMYHADRSPVGLFQTPDGRDGALATDDGPPASWAEVTRRKQGRCW